MKHKILFTADLHGNEFQYKKLVDYAIEISADSIVIGGDIAPKRFFIPPSEFYNSESYIIPGQRLFLDKELPKFLKRIKKKLPNSRVFMMMGQDDCAANLDVLEKNDPGLFRLIHEKRLKLTKDFDILGYSYVPITPFGIKDWDKYDLTEVPSDMLSNYEKRKTDYNLHGLKSTKNGWLDFQFTPEMEKVDSIQKDLEKQPFSENTGKTVYVFHSPPDNTNLDVDYEKNHLGSMAVRLFIEKYQPYLSLHGHIHETVQCSGDYKQKIGKTLCLTSGNGNHNSELSVLVFDLYETQNVTRKVI
jgi:Icc-related predicted phosphoesterase